MAEIESMGEACLARVEEMADLGAGGPSCRPRRTRAAWTPRSGRRWARTSASRAGATIDAGLDPPRRPDPGHLHQLPDRLAAAIWRARRLGRHRHRDLRQRRGRALELRGRAGAGGADGPTARYGYHLEQRLGTVLVELHDQLPRPATGALGCWIGRQVGDYWQVPRSPRRSSRPSTS